MKTDNMSACRHLRDVETLFETAYELIELVQYPLDQNKARRVIAMSGRINEAFARCVGFVSRITR